MKIVASRYTGIIYYDAVVKAAQAVGGEVVERREKYLPRSVPMGNFPSTSISNPVVEIPDDRKDEFDKIFRQLAHT